MNEQITLDIFLKDHVSKPLAKIKTKGEKNISHLSKSVKKLDSQLTKTFKPRDLKVNSRGIKKIKPSINYLELKLEKLERRRNITFDTHDLKKLNREIAQTEKQISKLKSSGTSSSLLGGLGGFIGVGAGITALGSIGKQMFEIRRERQKMEAVLTTSYNGDNDAAKMTMAQIQQFASKTPYSVNELTDAFIKLKNQGFEPSMSQMRKMGDVAASVGKSFDQFAEAVIDAQVGEFERLKAFGIKAKVNGDKIKFIFKGQTTEIENTSQAIQDYVVGLGDVEGVMGSTLSITQTLDGQISNLGDNWDALLNTMGSQTDGVFNNVISGLSDIIAQLNEAAKSAEQITIESKTKAYSSFKEGSVQRVKDYVASGMSQEEAIAKARQELIDNINKNKEAYKKQLIEAEKIKQATPSYMKNSTLSTIAGTLNPQSLSMINKLKSEVNKSNKLEGEIKAQTMALQKFNTWFKTGAKNGGNENNGGSSGTGNDTETDKVISDARAAKNLTINIDKLIESLNINTTTVEESAADIQNEVKKALLTAVNDANYAVK